MKTWKEQVYDTVTITKNEATAVRHLLQLMEFGADINPTFFEDIKKLKEKLK